MTLGSLAVRSTRELIHPDMRVCALVYAPSKFGKTTLAESMHRMTLATLKKPTLLIATEATEGGGAETLAHVDVPFVRISTHAELVGVLAALASDSTFGGAVLDSASDMSAGPLRRKALTYPNERDKDARREIGVPGRSDYQTMGQLTRDALQALINLTVLAPDKAKHVMVTAREKVVEDKGSVVRIGPALPGEMLEGAPGMFPTVGYIKIKRTVIPPATKEGKPEVRMDRVLVTEADGVRLAGDRLKVLPAEGPLDWVVLWERFYVPAIEAARGAK